MMRFFRAMLCLLGVAACRPGDARPTPIDTTPTAAAAAPIRVVDSVFPMDVMLDRFRKGLTEPSGLRGLATSQDDLVQRLIAALTASDTSAFEPMTLDRAEFAWLYYPTTASAKPPYELPPALAWFQLQEKNRKGAFRVLRELGSHRLGLKGYRCDPKPTIEGENRIWSGCLVTLSRDGERPVALKLFGAIIERGGRFEILSFDNDF